MHYWTKLVPKFHQVGEMSSVALRMRTAEGFKYNGPHRHLHQHTENGNLSSAGIKTSIVSLCAVCVILDP